MHMHTHAHTHTQHTTHTHLPQFHPLFAVGNVELQNKLEPSEEGFVDVLVEVGGEDDNAGEVLDVVQEHSYVHVGIAISGGAAWRGGGE